MYHTFKWTRPSIGRNFLTRHYEPLQPHLLMELAGSLQCDTFVDVGANIGAYSLLMTTLPSIKKVHAFEPSPETFGELQRNIELNDKAATIVAHNKAVSDAPKTLRFGIINTFSGANSVIGTTIHAAEKFEREIQVAGAPLDSFLTETGCRICLKVDVEGHEREALAGMSGLISRNEILLQIEDYSDSDAELTKLLGGSGFQHLFRIGADRYFTNIQPALDAAAIIASFERASAKLIESNLAALQESFGAEGVSPINIRLGKLLTVQLKGPTASLARKIRAKFRRSTARPN